ncbi:MAG: waaF [Paucimonas sp.]|nr:waaF [Paucimonas sp.]
MMPSPLPTAAAGLAPTGLAGMPAPASPGAAPLFEIPPERQQRWAQARKILCVRLDYMGDVLMCTPAIRALRESGTGGQARHITLLTSASGVAVAQMIPEIDAAIAYPAPWLKSSMPHSAELDQKIYAQLREQAFDAAVIFTTYSQSALPAALMCYLAGIPLRLAHCRENPYQLLTDWAPDPEPHNMLRHEVQRQLDLVAAAGCHSENQGLSFTVPEEAKQWADERLAMLDLKSDWVLMHPGATAASRRYPAASWAAAADLLASNLGLRVVFTGSPDEAPLIDAIRDTMHGDADSLAGELDLGRLGAVIARAPVMVANNTGPAHVAAALGTPLVDLYALTNPQHTPWQSPSKVLYHMVPCRNCYKSVCPQQHQDCLALVAPERVLEAVRELLAAPVANTDTALLLA